MRYAPLLSVFFLLAIAVSWLLFPPSFTWVYQLPWLSILISLLALLAALGLYDYYQPHHSLTRNYPLIARGRWWSEALRPFVHSYFVESDKSGKPYDRETRALIYKRAKDIEGVEPLGSEVDFNAPRIEWIAHSMAAKDVVGEAPRVAVGGKDCKRPYNASLLNISAMSFGSLGSHAIEALNKGAAMGGFAHDTGEGGLSRHHLKHGGDLIWEIGSAYYGCRDQNGRFDPERFREQAARDEVKMVEIKLSQGAKPGRGGILPAAKVTPAIAEARGIPVGQESISPPYHREFSTPVEMMEFVARLRDLSDGKPVGLKFCVGQPREVMALMKAMIKTGIAPDYIVVDGAEGGTGAAPTEFLNSVGWPLRDGMIVVRDALQGAGLKRQVRLAVSGKIATGADMAINLALGADWCNMARPFMFALGCVQSLQCHTNKCPTGVATTDPRRERGLVVEDKAVRVFNFHRNTVKAMREVAAAAGCEHPSELSPFHVRRRVTAGVVQGFQDVYPELPEGILLDAPDETPYGASWARAHAETGEVGT